MELVLIITYMTRNLLLQCSILNSILFEHWISSLFSLRITVLQLHYNNIFPEKFSLSEHMHQLVYVLKYGDEEHTIHKTKTT